MFGWIGSPPARLVAHDAFTDEWVGLGEDVATKTRAIAPTRGQARGRRFGDDAPDLAARDRRSIVEARGSNPIRWARAVEDAAETHRPPSSAINVSRSTFEGVSRRSSESGAIRADVAAEPLSNLY